PTSGATTTGLVRSQASAIRARLTPRSSATAPTASTMAWSLDWFGYSMSANGSRLDLPVASPHGRPSRPRASGLHTIVPTPSAAQAVVDFGHDCLAGEACAVGARAHGMADLRRDDHLVTVGKVLQCAAEDLLAGALGVHVGGVEEVDAGFQRVLDERTAVLLAE